MKGYRTLIGMGVALAAALYQYYIGPLPAIEPELWAVITAAFGFGMRFATSTPVGQKDES